jgi:alpha-tubulin suppressor-like RCC1 family protein
MSSRIILLAASGGSARYPELYTWGVNYYGEVGNGTSYYNLSPRQVGTASNWAQVAITDVVVAARRSDNTLWLWGVDDAPGLFGDNTRFASRSSPAQLGGAEWANVGGTETSFSAVKTNGTLWSWGSNANGRLGIGSVLSRSSPTQVGSLTNWSSVSGGRSQMFAIKTDGTLWAWGSNSDGALGINQASATVAGRSSPVQIATGIASVSGAQRNNGYAIRTNGTLLAWGDPNSGCLGDNQTTVFRSSPTQIGSATNWTKVSGGNYFVLAIRSPGTLWAWGNNDNGTLGINQSGSSSFRSSPVQVGALSDWIDVQAGNNISLGIRSNGTLWGWGDNRDGMVDLSLPFVRISSPTQIGSGTDWKALRVEKRSTSVSDLLVIKTDNTLWAWGNSITQQAFNVAPSVASPVLIPGGDWGQYVRRAYNSFASDEGGQSLALREDKTLWGWGKNHSGLLLTAPFFVASPVQISSSTDWQSISISAKFASQAAAIKENGTLWTWGDNEDGALGLNLDSATLPSASSPTQVGTLSDWAQVSCAQNNMILALKTNGTLWGWGAESYVLGTIDPVGISDRSSPVQIGSASNWTQVSVGFDFALAIRSDGTLWTWGLNSDGQLGRGNRTNTLAPLQLGTLTNWKAVAAGIRASYAIRADGTLWAWGSNFDGELGTNNIISRSSPVQVGSLNTWGKISAGDSFAIAQQRNGTLWSWGEAGSSLGLEPQINRSSPTQIGSLTTWGIPIAGSGGKAK